MKLLTLCLCFVTLGCGAGASTTAAPAAIVAELDAVYARFSQAYAELDPDMVANLYTRDALYLSPSRDIDRGRERIRKNFAGMFQRTRDAGESLRISFDRIDRRVSGDLAYEVGYYTLVRTSASGERKTSRGKFTVVLVRGKEDGTWRFKVDGYSAAPPASSP